MIVRRRARPVVAEAFHVPATRPIDARLIGGAALFGIGWALAGPAIAGLAIVPGPAAVFGLFMPIGFGLFRLTPSAR